ncbi:MAG: hypothetical protein IPK75_16005 [Acidobacteria bacterium]|jgi:hypothetical protein|nr:hypothetical protein [Acidobacteriota bacterium]
MDIQEARRIPDEEVERLLASDDEDERDLGHKIRIRKLAIARAEREMSADSDATLGIVGAIIFNFGGIWGVGLIATVLGLLMFSALAFGVMKRSSVKTYLIGIPALIIFGIGALRLVSQVAALF